MPSRHRAKPKFDIPVEADAVETPAGWVYRGTAEEPAPASGTAVKPEAETAERNPFLMVGEGLALFGIGSAILTYRAAMSMMSIMTMPMRLTGILKRD